MKAAKPLKGSTLRLYRRNLETGVLVHTLEVRDYADLTRTSGDESLDRWFGGRYRDSDGVCVARGGNRTTCGDGGYLRERSCPRMRC